MAPRPPRATHRLPQPAPPVDKCPRKIAPREALPHTFPALTAFASRAVLCRAGETQCPHVGSTARSRETCSREDVWRACPVVRTPLTRKGDGSRAVSLRGEGGRSGAQTGPGGGDGRGPAGTERGQGRRSPPAPDALAPLGLPRSLSRDHCVPPGEDPASRGLSGGLPLSSPGGRLQHSPHHTPSPLTTGTTLVSAVPPAQGRTCRRHSADIAEGRRPRRLSCWGVARPAGDRSPEASGPSLQK